MMMGLAGCVKEISPLEEPQAEGVEFSIFASTQSETKTEYIDGHITWSADDAMNVFHKGEGSYVNNYPFTVSDAATGKFDGRLKEALDASTSYKWFAVYPYDSEATSPEAATVRIGAAAGEAQAQTGDDSRLHLVGTGHPLYGTATTTGVQAPELTMHQAASIIGIKVKNETGTPLKVGEVTFTAPEAIVGDFTMDITRSEPAFTSTSAVSQTARLTVTDASTLAQDAEATYFLTIKPFTATSGAILKLSVNGYEKTITLTKDVIFHPGKIKTIGFGYNAEPATGYQLVTKEPSDWFGKYLVVSKDKSSIFTGATSTSNKVSLSDVDFDGDMIVKSGLEEYEFTITKEDENYYLQNGEYYVYCSGSADTKIGRSSISRQALKSDGFESDGSFVLWGTYGATQYLYFNGTNFKFGSSGKGVLLYKYSGSILVVKKDRNLAFSQEEVSKTFGDTAFTNALNGNTEGVTYRSSEPRVATVDDASGLVTIVGAGTATITATAEATNSLKAGSAEFTLTVAKAAQTISFSKTSVDFDMATGTFTAPTLSGAKTAVTYASSDANVAAVNSSTGTVTIKSVGTVTITATAAESANYTSATASYTINVTKSELVGYYQKVEAEPSSWDGTYLFVDEASSKAFAAFAANSSSYAVNVTISNGIILSDSSIDKYALTVKGLGFNHVNFSRAAYDITNSDDKYLYYSGGALQIMDSNTKYNTNTNSDVTYCHVLSFSTNAVQIVSSGNSNGFSQYFFQYRNDSFTYVKDTQGNGVQLYKYVVGNPPAAPTVKTFTKVNSVTAGKNYVIVDTNAKMALKNDPSGSNSELYDQAYSVDGMISGNTLTVPEDDAAAITWAANTSNAHTTQGTLTFSNSGYYLARGNTTANGDNDTVLLPAVNAYSVWTFNGSNLSMKNSSAQYTFYLFYKTSEKHWDTDQQSATNNIAIFVED